MKKRRQIIYTSVLLTVIFAINILWACTASSKWERVSLAYAPDTLPRDLPITVYYPQGKTWPIYVPHGEDSEEWYISIESLIDDFWIYETYNPVYEISEIQEALSLMESQGEISLSVQGHSISAQMWNPREEGEHGGALVFSLGHTNLAVFWHNKSMDEVKALISTLRPVK